MPCFTPLDAWQSFPAGKKQITFKPLKGHASVPLQLPCGQCRGCRLERSRHWAVRCVHESQLHKKNSFITLTYSPENLPYGGSLEKTHFQKFMKRLRKAYAPEKIRFFHCGEYGEKLSRPHYHAILFGLDFEDKTPIRTGSHLHSSAILDKIWGLGHTSVGSVSFQSCAYVARYCMKKITGKLAENHYSRIVESTGEIIQIQPEYTTMSRRPGIGRTWFDKFQSDVYPDDFVIMDLKKVTPPRFYDDLLKKQSVTLFDEIKRKRRNAVAQHAENNTPERLAVRAQCLDARLTNLKRELHDS